MFSVDTVLSRSWNAFSRHPVFFLSLGAMDVAVKTLLNQVAGASKEGALLLALIKFVNPLPALMVGVAAYGVFQILRGQPVSPGGAILKSLGRVFHLCGVSILTTLGILLCSVLLVFPGIILFCMFFVAIPVCVVERKGVMASLKRSDELTKGYRWTIFAVFLLLSFIVMAGGISLWAIGWRHVENLSGSFSFTFFLMPWVAFYNVAVGVIYCDLKAAADGEYTDGLADVFD